MIFPRVTIPRLANIPIISTDSESITKPIGIKYQLGANN
jgi:hypothetical protein